MTEATIDAHPTFTPGYGILIIPDDARTEEERALRLFARKRRVERIKANIALYPSRSLFEGAAERQAG